MEQLTKNQAVATSQEAVQNQNEPQLRDENAHNDKSVHGVLNPTYQAGRSEERFSRNAETDLVCRLLLEKKKPRSFADSDNNGMGDINGITSKLTYLKELGIDAIWITHCFPSPQVDYGYNVSAY